jgi:hypothetical protein
MFYLRTLPSLKLLPDKSGRQKLNLNQMKKQTISHIVIGLMLILGAKSVIAQQKFYMKNGNSWEYKLLEATEDKVKYNQINGERKILRTWNRDNILVAFNARGNYLMVSHIETSTAQSRKQLDDFYNSEGPKTDLIVRAAPTEVIACTITYQSTEVINYKNQKGQAASIVLSNVVAVIRTNGQHQILQDINEAAPLLSSVYKQVQDLKGVVIPPVVPDSTPPPPPPAKPFLSNIEIETYKEKAMQRVKDFSGYLNNITDKKLSNIQREEAINQAVKLFLPDAMVEVTSLNSPIVRKYAVRTYLNRLKVLPYGKTTIEWNEVKYVSEPKQEADGNYYGIVRGVQTFIGYGSGKTANDVVYSDITEKNIRTKFEAYEKIRNGQITAEWQILLGNIGIGSEVK